MADEKTPTQTPSDKAATDNRANQLNEQNPTFYRGRGHAPDESQTLAKEKTQSNQDKKGK